MKTILKLAAASALFGIAGFAAAEPAPQDHASHNHAVPVAPAASPTPTASPTEMKCDHAMPGGAPMAGMSGMQGMAGKDRGSMDYQHMMSGDMKGCDQMMHGGTMPMAPAPSPSPSAAPKP